MQSEAKIRAELARIEAVLETMDEDTDDHIALNGAARALEWVLGEADLPPSAAFDDDGA